jgi:hypothetical protein
VVVVKIPVSWLYEATENELQKSGMAILKKCEHCPQSHCFRNNRLPSDFSVEVEGVYVEVFNILFNLIQNLNLKFFMVSFEAFNLLIQESYFNNPTHVTLSQSSKASCLGIVSLEAHSKVAAAALCLCLSPGNYGVHMVHPLAWPTQLPGSPASPQRAGLWSPWTPEKGR